MSIPYKGKRKFGYVILPPLICLLILTVLVSLRFGTLQLTFREIMHTLVTGEPRQHWMILTQIRLPRIVSACLSGAALAVSGSVLQSVLRNPLASPGIIGISAGAGLSGTALILLFPQYAGFMIPCSFCGGFAAAVFVFALSWKRGLQPANMILAGVAVGSFAGACTSAVLLLHAENAGAVLSFTIGGFSAKSWGQIGTCSLYIGITFVLLILYADHLNILSMGDDTASALGLNVTGNRIFFLACAALLAASAVSLAGLLNFAGLIAPHMVRLLSKNDSRVLIPGSALTGAVMVLLCDTIGRTAASPIEIPAGIILSLTGVPFFLFLLRQKMKAV